MPSLSTFRQKGYFYLLSVKSRGTIARKCERSRSARARVARARAREGVARSRKIFARFYFLHISLACARDARSRAGIARERARSRGARARDARARAGKSCAIVPLIKSAFSYRIIISILKEYTHSF